MPRKLTNACPSTLPAHRGGRRPGAGRKLASTASDRLKLSLLLEAIRADSVAVGQTVGVIGAGLPDCLAAELLRRLARELITGTKEPGFSSMPRHELRELMARFLRPETGITLDELVEGILLLEKENCARSYSYRWRLLQHLR